MPELLASLQDQFQDSGFPSLSSSPASHVEVMQVHVNQKIIYANVLPVANTSPGVRKPATSMTVENSLGNRSGLLTPSRRAEAPAYASANVGAQPVCAEDPAETHLLQDTVH